MDVLDIGLRLLLSFALGAAMGLEREINHKKSSIHNGVPTAVFGLRSFALMTVFGAITGFIYLKFVPLALLIAAAFFMMLLIFYYLDSQATKDHGLTTEVAALYSFIIGLLLAMDVFPIQMTIAVTTVVILILSYKDKIKNVVDDIGRNELNAFISYAILALVIMPFLPNTTYSLSDVKGLGTLAHNMGIPLQSIARVELFNPFKIWVVLVLITGIDFVSYVLGRVIGTQRGILLTSALGGLVSSTAATQAIAQQSKKSMHHNHLVASAVLANLVSFFQIAVLVGAINGMFLVKLAPVILLMIFTSAVLFIFFLRSKEKGTPTKSQGTEEHTGTIIDLSGALKFAGLYLAISIISKLALALFGKTGLFVATGIGALIGLDAVMINTSQLAGGRIDYGIAVLAFILANTINLGAKSLYTFGMGTRKFAVKFSLSMAIIILASAVGYIAFI